MEFKSQDKIPLGILIKNRLKELGWTQRKLSEKTGASEACISRVINGSGLVDVKNIYSILGILGLLRIDEPQDVADKKWTFSRKAKIKYRDLQDVVAHANKAVKINDTSLLRSILIGVAERLKNIENQQIKREKTLRRKAI